MDTQLLLLLTLVFPTFLLVHRLLRKPSFPLPPGPCGLPILGSLLQVGPLPHRSLFALSKTYGPIMHIRMGSTPAIIVSSSTFAELFLKTHDASFANRPPSEMFRLLFYKSKSFSFSDNGPYWRHVRKLCVAHLLGAPKVASLCSSRKEEVNLLVQHLNTKAVSREEVNVSEVLAETLADIVCRMVVGRKCMTDDEDGRKFRARTRELMGLLSAFNVNDFIPALGFLDLQGLRRRMKVLSAEFDAFLEKIVEEHVVGRRKERDSENKDFVDVILGFVEAGEEVEGEKFGFNTVKAIVLVNIYLYISLVTLFKHQKSRTGDKR